MNGRSLVALISRLPTMRRWPLLGLMLLLTIPVGSLAIALTPPGSPVATWWPGAALTVVAVLSARGNRLVVLLAVVVVTTIANLVAGRPLALSIAFGVANAAEAWVVASITAGPRRDPELLTIRNAIRFLLAVICGGAAIGVVAGVAVTVLAGGDFVATATSLMASHMSSVVLLVPLALLQPSAFTTSRARELVLQALVLAVFVGGVFAPGQSYSLAFLPFPVLAWAALRFGTGLLLIETVGVAIAVTLLTTAGGGPFAQYSDDSPLVTIHLIQAYLVVMAGSMLVIAKGESERAQLMTRVRSRETVLNAALLGSAGGFAILENSGGDVFRLAAINDQARQLLSISDDLQLGGVIRARDFPVKVTYHVRRSRLTPGLEWDGDLPSEGGPMSVRAHVTRVDSVGEGYVVVVQAEDTTAQTRAAAALANALEAERSTVERLQELGRQQEDFVAAVSHELRTPLTSIVGFSDELADLDLPEPAPGYLDVVRRNVRRLRGLVEDLLYVSRMTSTSAQRDLAPVDLDELLAETREDMSPLAASRDVQVSVVDPGSAGTIISVRTEVARVLTNLVSNAIKFAPDGGHVQLTAQRDDDRVTLRVIDDGPGISQADLERVFERFYRAPSATPIAGTGLGLAITRGLAERLGGEVLLESDGSTGTTAIVCLPFTAPDEVAGGDALPEPAQ